MSQAPSSKRGKGGGVSPHVAAVTVEAYANTWLSIQGKGGIAEALIGSKPDDPLCDISYSVLSSLVFQEAVRGVKELGLVWELPPSRL